MRTARERPRVVLAVLLGVALIVAVVLLAAGGGTDGKVANAQRAETAANKRADRAEADLADQKARVKQLDGDLRRAQAAAARAGRRATIATRRSRQLRGALSRERRRR